MSEDQQQQPPDEQQQDQQQAPSEEKISMSEYKKLMAQLEDQKKRFNAAQDALKGKEIEQMKADKRWQEIAEMREKEAREANEKYESMSQAVRNDRKMSAIKTAALSAGIRKEALDDLELFDFPEVNIETTSSGGFSVMGAKEAIDALKVRKPYLFAKPSSALNSSSPEVVNSGKITIEQVRKAQMQWNKTRSREDLQAYETALKQFKSSR